MTATDEERIGIELPPLNMTLVEVHLELTIMHNGAKDMVTKNKCAKMAEKYVQKQLDEAHKKIADFRATAANRSHRRAPPTEVERVKEDLATLTMTLYFHGRGSTVRSAGRIAQIVEHGKGSTGDDTKSGQRTLGAAASGNFSSPIDRQSL